MWRFPVNPCTGFSWLCHQGLACKKVDDLLMTSLSTLSPHVAASWFRSTSNIEDGSKVGIEKGYEGTLILVVQAWSLRFPSRRHARAEE